MQNPHESTFLSSLLLWVSLALGFVPVFYWMVRDDAVPAHNTYDILSLVSIGLSILTFVAMTRVTEARTKRVSERFRIRREGHENAVGGILQDIGSAPLPAIPTRLILKKGEVVHHAVPAYASVYSQQTRTVKTRTHSSGFVHRFRLGSGTSYVISTMRPHYTTSKVTTDHVIPKGTGTLYVTSHRILFDPDELHQANLVFTKATLLGIRATDTDEIVLEPTKGKPVVFQVPTDAYDLPVQPFYDSRVIQTLAHRVLR